MKKNPQKSARTNIKFTFQNVMSIAIISIKPHFCYII